MKKNLKRTILSLLFAAVMFPVSAIFAETGTAPQKPSFRKKELPAAMLENFPVAEQERLKKLYRESPEQFRKEIRKMFWENRKKQMQEVIALRERYLKSQDSAEKAAIEKELRSRISAQMEKHARFAEKNIEKYENRIRHMQQRVDHLKAETERRKANQPEIVEKVVKNILDPAQDPANWCKKPAKR